MLVPEQHFPQQAPQAQDITHLQRFFANSTSRTAGAVDTIHSVRVRVLAHGGDPIACDPSGCCLWIARTLVAAARRRLYEAGRGRLARGTQIVSACGTTRCVNLDHLRLSSNARAGRKAPAIQTCPRGHEVSPESVVRHRDGRIAYCRLCRNEGRRERYRTDPSFAEREVARQRRLRTRSKRVCRCSIISLSSLRRPFRPK